MSINTMYKWQNFINSFCMFAILHRNYMFAVVLVCCTASIDAQKPAPIVYTQSTQPGIYSIVFPGRPTTRGPLRQRNALGKWVEVVIDEVELPASAKANLSYVAMCGADKATPISLRTNLPANAALADRIYDKLYGSNGSIVYSRLVTPPELAPLKLTCQEIVWRNKKGDFACLRTFYHRGMAITLAVSGTGSTFNKIEVARFLYSFKPL